MASSGRFDNWKACWYFSFGWLAASPMRLGMPQGMRLIDLIVIGFVSAIGFTVSLFVATVAFDAGPVQDAAKMGACLVLQQPLSP